MKNKALPNAHEFNFTSIQGETIKLKNYYGKPILIVNTASLCGFTNQYNDLEELNTKYGKSNLIIMVLRNINQMKKLTIFVKQTSI